MNTNENVSFLLSLYVYVSQMNSSQGKYRQICAQHPEIPLFLQAWWLDASSPHNWDILWYEKQGVLCGIWVLAYHKKWGKTFTLQPVLTPYSGTFLFYPENLNTEQRTSFEYEVLTHLIERLKEKHIDFYEQRFHPSCANWQPFYWEGFKQTTYYTYQLHHLEDTDSLLKNMSRRKRQKIQQKTLLDEFTLSTELNANDFYDFYVSTLEAKGKTILYSKDYFLGLYQAAQERRQGQILALYDKKNQLHVALWIVWDQHAAYNMIIAIAPDHKNSGASPRIIWEAIQWVKDKTKCFDFEGSMIHGVALNYQSYGAVAVPYSCIWKIKSPLLKLWYYWKKRNR